MVVKIQQEDNLGKLRVATFCRVSTKGQLDGDDIPMQKRACRDFIEKQGWTLVKEYIEKGISGYKVSASNRDEIQRAKVDAELGLYDILLVFMFDRLGRREDETPFVLKWFSNHGVQTWSVKEGQQKFEDHSDDLINFIRFWQSSGESKKTSMRVNEKHMQMVEDGEYRGGTVPFGYDLVKSGVTNKKGKELMIPVINEEEAKIARLMFYKVSEEGYGSHRIAKLLNGMGITTKTGSKWGAGSINFILRNPMYKGVYTYGKRTSKIGIFEKQDKENWTRSNIIPELAIIDEETWDKVQEIRSSKTLSDTRNDNVQKITKSPLLFVGLTRCGHCGSAMTTTYNSKTHVLKGGEIKKYVSPKYRCSGKALGSRDCDGQTVYAPIKLEGLILDEVDKYLDRLRKVDLTTEIGEFRKKNVNVFVKELNSIQSKIESAYNELSVLNNEVPKSLMGKSSFKPELLSNLIAQKEKEISELSLSLSEAENTVRQNKVEASDLETLQKHIPVWKKVFEEASHEKKKVMLGSIVEQVNVRRDGVKIRVRLSLDHFMGQNVGSETDIAGSPRKSITLPKKFLTDFITSMYAS